MKTILFSILCLYLLAGCTGEENRFSETLKDTVITDTIPDGSENFTRNDDPGECPESKVKEDTIDLHIHLQNISRKNQDAFGMMIEKDGIKLLFHEYADETEDPLISIRITKNQFSKIFKGKVHYAMLMGSSDGYVCQMIIDEYQLPSRYSTYAERIDVPDPQLY